MKNTESLASKSLLTLGAKDGILQSIIDKLDHFQSFDPLSGSLSRLRHRDSEAPEPLESITLIYVEEKKDFF